MEVNQFIHFLRYIKNNPDVIDKIIKKLENIPEEHRLNYTVDDIEFGDSKPFVAFCLGNPSWVYEQVDLD